jgi:hypothetical protein
MGHLRDASDVRPAARTHPLYTTNRRTAKKTSVIALTTLSLHSNTQIDQRSEFSNVTGRGPAGVKFTIPER